VIFVKISIFLRRGDATPEATAGEGTQKAIQVFEGGSGVYRQDK